MIFLKRSSWRLLGTLASSLAPALVSLIDWVVTKFLLFYTSSCWTSYGMLTFFMKVLGMKRCSKLFIIHAISMVRNGIGLLVKNITKSPFRTKAISLNGSCTLINGFLWCSTKLSNDLLSLSLELWDFCNMNLISFTAQPHIWVPLSATTSFFNHLVRENLWGNSVASANLR